MRTVKHRASNMKTNVFPLIHRAVSCSEVTGNTLLALRENAARCILNIDGSRKLKCRCVRRKFLLGHIVLLFNQLRIFKSEIIFGKPCACKRIGSVQNYHFRNDSIGDWCKLR